VGPSQFLCDFALSRDLLVQEYPFSGAELIFNTAASIACHPKKISPKQKKIISCDLWHLQNRPFQPHPKSLATSFEGVIAVQRAVLCADSLALGVPYIMAA